MHKDDKIIKCGNCKNPLRIIVINAREFSFHIECAGCGFLLESSPSINSALKSKKIQLSKSCRHFTYADKVETLKKFGFTVDEEGFANW